MKKLLTVLLTIMLAVTVQGQYMLYRSGNVYYHNGSAFIKLDTTLIRILGISEFPYVKTLTSDVVWTSVGKSFRMQGIPATGYSVYSLLMDTTQITHSISGNFGSETCLMSLDMMNRKAPVFRTYISGVLGNKTTSMTQDSIKVKIEGKQEVTDTIRSNKGIRSPGYYNMNGTPYTDATKLNIANTTGWSLTNTYNSTGYHSVQTFTTNGYLTNYQPGITLKNESSVSNEKSIIAMGNGNQTDYNREIHLIRLISAGKGGSYQTIYSQDTLTLTITLPTNIKAITTNGQVKTGQISAALTDNVPTDSELDTAIGSTPATVGAGWQCFIKDNNGTGLVYRIYSDGNYYYYQVMTKAL